MMKRTLTVLLVALALVSVANAGSKTPYKHSFAGNLFTSETRYTYRWLAQHFDMSMSGSNDFL
ncbi:MAG: hypothetical protein PHR28_12270, partial [candidate division Zixibacteria bacterium]|nr:hypothetical protein [candidate division Zixibacteria bacterium]